VNKLADIAATVDYSIFLVLRMGSAGTLNPDPHQSGKLDPDPHLSEK
jgi:hypothetical protein